MAREITIHEVGDDVLRAELAYVIQYFRRLGHERCQVCFGWHWGMDYPPANPWGLLDIPLTEVEAEVHKVEEADLGQIGGDDLDILVPLLDYKFRFCHHDGIHLQFTEPNQASEEFFERWLSAGLAPIVEENTTGF